VCKVLFDTAKIKLTTIAKAMTMLSNMSANHKCVATPITNAQIKPFNKPIATSLFINTLRLEFVSIWLGVNLVTVFIAVFFISLFEATLQEKIALAILMPVVASMGGIAGTQTLILVTRGIATGRITNSNLKKHRNKNSNQIHTQPNTTAFRALHHRCKNIFLFVQACHWSPVVLPLAE
jgi:hypothetical protein